MEEVKDIEETKVIQDEEVLEDVNPTSEQEGKVKSEKTASKEKAKKVKAQKTDRQEKAQKIKIALSGFHNQCTTSGLSLSILSIIFSFFVLVVSLSVKAQTGIIVVLLVVLVIYMFVIGLIGLSIALYSITITCKKLSDKKNLIAFILALTSIAMIAGSICIVYLT